jgi:hypothetical protein
MQPNLDTIQNILFLELRPWLNRTTPEAKYKQLHEELKKVHFSYQPLYETVFPKPLTAKRKYYQALIESEVIEYLNDLNTAISEADIANEKKYWVHTALTKVLSQKLRDISKVIESFNFNLSNLASKSENIDIKDDSYIIQYLRLQLMRIYLEVQDRYKENLKEEPISFQELNEKYFSESISADSIKNASKIKQVTSKIDTDATHPTEEFKPIARDTQSENIPPTILKYQEVIKNQDRFLRFEQHLFDNGFIDNNYSFQNKHGRKQELAAAYIIMINKGCFHSMKHPGKKKIKETAIRKFLDYRYKANTDKLFREWLNNPEAHHTFVDSRHWLDKLGSI